MHKTDEETQAIMQPEFRQPSFRGVSEVYSQSNAKKQTGGLHSGTTTPASPDSKKSQNRTKRKAKNQTGIWIIEKSLDKKNWVPVREIIVLTRAKAEQYICELDVQSQDFGIHYRVTRYEPSR